VPPRQSSPKKSPAGSRPRSRSTAAGKGATAKQETSDSVRDQIRRHLNLLDLVVLTRDRMQEAVDDAVERGRMTRDDATALVTTLVERSRRQTEDLISELESAIGGAGRRAGQARAKTRKAAAAPADRLLREVDRARRVAGIGPSFPVVGYDDLTAAQVTDRLDALSAPELRKVRDYERRNANRKSVLQAIERKLA
jgi:polyhydroxyalkanoate synthesis regulator phasin